MALQRQGWRETRRAPMERLTPAGTPPVIQELIAYFSFAALAS